MKKYDYSKENLLSLFEGAETLSEIARRLTKKDVAHGNIIKLVRSKLTEYEIDFSHLKGMGWSQGKGYSKNNKRLTKQDFVENYLSSNPNKRTSSSGLKKRLFEYGLKENKCEECGIENSWNNKPIVNQLDHIDGNSSNNSLENLKIICPNCHSQTDTFTGKNIIKQGKHLAG